MGILCNSAETRLCAFCKSPAIMDSDTKARRTYACSSCDAAKVISKSDRSWWYHGWRKPDGQRITYK